MVDKLRPEAHAPGDIVGVSGQVCGQHEGIINYTVGQRRGLGLGGRPEGEEALYVVRLEPDAQRVVVGPRRALGVDRLEIGTVNWLGTGSIPAEGVACSVKLRSSMSPVAARIEAAGQNGATVVLEEIGRASCRERV